MSAILFVAILLVNLHQKSRDTTCEIWSLKGEFIPWESLESRFEIISKIIRREIKVFTFRVKMVKQVRFQEKVSLVDCDPQNGSVFNISSQPLVEDVASRTSHFQQVTGCQESASCASHASTEEDAAFLCVKTLPRAFGMYMKKKHGANCWPFHLKLRASKWRR